MRPIRGLATLAVLTMPLLAWSAPGHAETQNGLLDQAQRMLGNNNGSDRDRDAYERGREDEHRRAAAREDRRRYGAREDYGDRGNWNDRDRSGWNDRDRAYNPAR
jgi:hypothetical protein